MKIAYLGAGAWGFCLANLLANKGYQVCSWTTKPELIQHINSEGSHPFFPDVPASKNLTLTEDLAEALDGAELLVESVTSAGMRPVFQQVHALGKLDIPIILTSKGIEQDSGLILSEVAMEVLGADIKPLIGCISGPSYADEVVRGLPASVVGAGYSDDVIETACTTFQTPKFRVYPNQDVRGVAFGGALKNIMAIACGICDGLNLGQSSKAALMTRGLHEMCKLAVASGCQQSTLYGLSGMGDLCVTCACSVSRNFRFGQLLAKGSSPEEAKEEIGMVVEGAYTCVSAAQLGRRLKVSMPITEGIYQVVYKGYNPRDGVEALMSREIKEEHL